MTLLISSSVCRRFYGFSVDAINSLNKNYMSGLSGGIEGRTLTIHTKMRTLSKCDRFSPTKKIIDLLFVDA